ncbi:MAG: presqualene diphosphate synthase HpnD [Janthinobacterium lividum]
MAIADSVGTSDREDLAPPPQRQAAGSSFYLAMRLLPRRQREAMYAVYGFCRAVDDIADGDAPRAERLEQLDAWQRNIDSIYAAAPSPALESLARAALRFNLNRLDFYAVIDGMRTDALADVRAPNEAELDLYCDRVASAVGRLSTPIFGMPTAAGIELAHHLGRALQLTNILRDLDEDAAIGRLYLPREALIAAGLSGQPDFSTMDPLLLLADPALPLACAPVVERARAHYRQAQAIMVGCARRQVRAPRIMASVYGALLERMAEQGFAAPRTRVRLSRAALLRTVLRCVLI